MSSPQKSPDFYQNYASQFYSYYKEISKKTIEELDIAGFAIYQSAMRLDKIIDDKDTTEILSALALQEDAIKILTSIFNKDSKFWNLWNLRKTEFHDAISLEKSLWENPTFERYQDVADKKSAFGKVAIDCLFLLSESSNKEIYNLLLESHRYFSIGFQLHDDVKDFSEDFNKKQFNWAVYELSKIVDYSKYSNDVVLLNKVLYVEGIGVNILNKSITYFEKAKEIINELSEASLWCNTIDRCKHSIQLYKNVTEGYIKTIQEKAKIRKKITDGEFLDLKDITNQVFSKGLNVIKSDYFHNYIDLKHIMYLGSVDDFENDTDVHSSDTFQRALLNDCLLEITQHFNIDTGDFFEKENQYLVDRQNNDSVGAWSYFLTVREIASDIDDLGQIMQQFMKTNHYELVDRYCLKAIDTAISDRTNDNGGIETWIIPKENLTEKQQKQDWCNSTKWGKGPDVEVVANFVYALTLFNAEKYQHTIERAIDYILSEQKESGFWESRWYYGKFYGTYVCLRLLCQFPDQYQSVKQRIKKFLKDSQNEDGSFDEKQYNILSTSFAIFCLNLLQSPELNEIKQKAQKYLSGNQLHDGSWKAEILIKPKASEPYSSKTLTTVYALRALL